MGLRHRKLSSWASVTQQVHSWPKQSHMILQFVHYGSECLV